VFVSALVLGVGFAWRSRTAREPLVDRGLARIRNFDVACAVFTVSMVGFFGYTLNNALFLTGEWHYSLAQAGGAMTPAAIIGFVLARPSSKLVARHGFRPVLVLATALWGLGVLLLSLLTTANSDFLGVWLPVNALMGAAGGVVVANGGTAITSAAPGQRFATANAIRTVLRAVGGALGVAAAAAVLTGHSTRPLAGFQSAWLFGACCLFAAALGYIALGDYGRAAVAVAPAAGSTGTARR
ncbi:MAG: MFS transporter, partial [Solirubrobacteraceae bacterium]